MIELNLDLPVPKQEFSKKKTVGMYVYLEKIDLGHGQKCDGIFEEICSENKFGYTFSNQDHKRYFKGLIMRF